MTLLDELRARTQLAQKANVDVTAVTEMTIWGNHSATQYPDFYHATIKGKPAHSVITDEQWLKGEFIETVQKRGAAIIKARGASSAASAANAVVDTVRNLRKPTPAGECFSVAVSSDGSYGVEKGLMFGFPVQSTAKGWEIVQGITHNDFGKEKLSITLKELLSEKEAVAQML